MGCCCCKARSDVDDFAENKHNPKSPSFGQPWHEDEKMSYAEKVKIAKEHSHAECFLCKCCGIFGAWTGLKCCCCHFTPDKPLLSIKRDRHCTDLPCCALFLLTLMAQVGLVIYAVTTLDADPRWLVYYTDYQGQLCAPDWTEESFSDNFDIFSNASTAGNYAAWPDIRMYDLRICVDACNETLVDDRMVTPSFDSDLDDIDVSTEGVSIDISGYESVNILDAICIPNPDYASDIASSVLDADYSGFEDSFDNLADQIEIAIGDVETAWMLFFATAVSALMVSMCWGWLIRQIGAIIIWLSIFATLAGVFGIAYFP